MNLSVIALAVLAWKLFSDNQRERQKDTQPKIGIADLLNDDVKTVIEGAEKLTSRDTNAEEKMGAILGLMSNPTVMSFAESFFGQKKAPQDEPPQAPQKDAFTNDEGYNFGKPSNACQEFFRPIDNIADAEVKNKLYWFYDNWYL